MSSHPELYLHLKTLNFFGLISCECLQDKDRQLKIVTLPSHEIKAVAKLFVVLFVCSIMLTYWYTCIDDFYIPMFTETGNQHAILLFACGCLMVISFYSYLYVARLRNISFLKDILHYYNDLCKRGGAKNCKPCRRQFFLYLQISLFSLMVNNICFRQEVWTAKLCLIMLHTCVMMVVGSVISLYVSIVRICIMAMQHLNAELNAAATMENQSANLRYLQDIILRRNQLIGICNEGVNSRFSLLLLLTVPYIMLLTPSGPYLVLLKFLELDFIQNMWEILIPAIITSGWITPWMILFVQMCKSSGLTIE
uniref:Gustatory receptor n=1 Tax=Stomoxys calcitrans TaxID=35570 RepID=A0A454A0P7_STOCA